MTELKSKRDRIVFLLDHWEDFSATLHQADQHAGDDPDAVTGMPRMYHHPSVRELRRVLAVASINTPGCYGHLMAFFGSEWRTTDAQVRVKRNTRTSSKKAKTEVVTMRVRQRVVPRWVDHRKVERGVVFVVAAFTGEVFIPSELLEPVVAKQQAAA